MSHQDDVKRGAALVIRAIKRTDERGNPVYSEEQIRHAIPWIAFTLGADIHALNERVQGIIAQFMVSLKLREGVTPEEVRAAVREYYERNPIAPGLMSDVQIALRRAVAEVASANSGEAAHGKTFAGRPRTEVLRTALRPAVGE